MAARQRRTRPSISLPGRRSLPVHLIYRKFGFAGLIVFIAIVLLVSLFQKSSVLPASGDWQTYHLKTFKVVHVVDGDTIHIDLPDGGKRHTVIRFWGVDTPELKKREDEPPDQPFAQEARDLVREMTLGRQVTLQLEEHSLRDRYGRLLAHIVLPDGRLLNAMLLERGFAKTMPQYAHSRLDEYEDIQKTARRHKAGMWGGASSGGSKATKTPSPSSSPAGVPEAETSSSDMATYHMKKFKVIQVVDGDTLRVNQPDGQRRNTLVRFWGIDAPEVQQRSDDPPDQPFGREALERVLELAQGREVTLQLEEHSPRDRYGRLLAYIILPDGKVLNELLIEEGLARADPRHPHSRFDAYASLQTIARKKKVGMWGMQSSTTNNRRETVKTSR